MAETSTVRNNRLTSSIMDSFELYSSSSEDDFIDDDDDDDDDEDDDEDDQRNSSRYTSYSNSVQTLSDDDNEDDENHHQRQQQRQRDIANDDDDDDDDDDGDDGDDGDDAYDVDSTDTGDDQQRTHYSSFPNNYPDEETTEQKQSNTSTSSSKSRKSSSSAMISSLKKRWKGVKKAGARGTSSAGKGLSSISASYFGTGREPETWEERHSRISDEWINCIIPAWSKKRKTSRVRTLVFRGIPANVRGRVWQCAIGNPINISEELFIVLKERAAKGRAMFQARRIDGTKTVDIGDLDNVERYISWYSTSNSSNTTTGNNHHNHHNNYMNIRNGMEENERSAHKAISLDLPRTFPELSFFHAEGSHYEHALRDVLEAFLYLKPDVGYSQGMSFVAAVLLLYMDPYEAFCCFSNMLLYKSCFLNFFRIQMPDVKCYLLVHEKLLEEEMPTLFQHFKRHGIESDLYMINWVMSLYCRALRLDLVTRIWDLYVLDGDVAIFRSALGILRLFMNQLLTMKFEEMAYFLSHIPSEQIDADRLLQSIRSIRVVSNKKFRHLFEQFRSQHS